MDLGLTKTGAAIEHSFVSGYAGASEAIDEAAICDDIQRLANAIGMANGKQDHFDLGHAVNVDYEFVKDAVGKSSNGGRLKTRKQERHLMHSFPTTPDTADSPNRRKWAMLSSEEGCHDRHGNSQYHRGVEIPSLPLVMSALWAT